jgi:hypothetical protein
MSASKARVGYILSFCDGARERESQQEVSLYFPLKTLSFAEASRPPPVEMRYAQGDMWSVTRKAFKGYQFIDYSSLSTPSSH